MSYGGCAVNLGAPLGRSYLGGGAWLTLLAASAVLRLCLETDTDLTKLD